MTIKTATGIQSFQDEKGYGKWFDTFSPLVKIRDACQPDTQLNPPHLMILGRKRRCQKHCRILFLKIISLPKTNNVAEAVDLLKQVVEKDPAKDE